MSAGSLALLFAGASFLFVVVARSRRASRRLDALTRARRERMARLEEVQQGRNERLAAMGQANRERMELIRRMLAERSGYHDPLRDNAPCVLYSPLAQEQMSRSEINGEYVETVLADPGRTVSRPRELAVAVERTFGNRTLRVLVSSPWPSFGSVYVKGVGWKDGCCPEENGSGG